MGTRNSTDPVALPTDLTFKINSLLTNCYITNFELMMQGDQ